jgi:hypothetical protein
VLAADRVFFGRLLRRQVVAHAASQVRQPEAIVAQSMKQFHDERGIGRGGKCLATAALVGVRDVRVGCIARGARHQQFVHQSPEVLDERELQHARPGPQFTDRQRRHALIALEELEQLLAGEPAVTVAHELDGDGVYPRLAGAFTGCQGGQGPIIAARQVPSDVRDLRCDQVKIVEEPFGRRRQKALRLDVLRERAVRAAQHPDVVLEAGKGIAGPPVRSRIDRKAGREGKRALLESLDAQELVAQRLVGLPRLTPPGQQRQAAHKACGWRGIVVAEGPSSGIRFLRECASVRAEGRIGRRTQERREYEVSIRRDRQLCGEYVRRRVRRPIPATCPDARNQRLTTARSESVPRSCASGRTCRLRTRTPSATC